MKRSTIEAVMVTAALFAVQTPAFAGGTHTSAQGHSDDHYAVDIGRAGKAAQVDRMIEVRMGEMFFDPGTVKVAKDETIRFVITNTGDFVHEFNIGTAEMHKAHSGEMAKMMEMGILDADQINHDRMKKSGMAHEYTSSVLLEPGQTSELIWTFSGDADLELSCNVPGHRESGMRGTVTMQRSHLES